jgi:hypothetical protein
VEASSTSVSADPPGGIGVEGKKLVLIDRYVASGKAKAVFVSKDTTLGSIHKGVSSDPPNLSGTVEIFPLSDPTNRLVYDLSDQLPPPDGDGGHWLVNKPTVAKYVNKTANPGVRGAKVVVVKPAKVLKVVGKNLGDGDAATGNDSATDLDLSTLTVDDTIRVIVTIDNTGNLPPDTHIMCADFVNPVIKQIAGGTGYKLLSKASNVPVTCETPYGSPSHAFLLRTSGLLD